MIVNAKTFKPIGRFGKLERQEYAKRKSAEEEAAVLTDRSKVKKQASLFEQHVQREREALGLNNRRGKQCVWLF